MSEMVERVARVLADDLGCDPHHVVSLARAAIEATGVERLRTVLQTIADQDSGKPDSHSRSDAMAALARAALKEPASAAVK